MNRKNGSYFRIGIALMLGLMVSGCTTSKPAKPQAPLSPTIDRCADRLQEICGIILEYYVDNRQIPAAMEQLQAMAVKQAEPPDLFICPVSKLRYIYHPAGIAISWLNPPAQLVMWDAEAVHDGHRWGIAISHPGGNHPIICRVIQVPDRLNLNTATTEP